MGEKERFEVLLEEIRGEVKMIAEGLMALREAMDRRFAFLELQIAELRSEFKFFVKHVDQRLVSLETKLK